MAVGSGWVQACLIAVMVMGRRCNELGGSWLMFMVHG